MSPTIGGMLKKAKKTVKKARKNSPKIKKTTGLKKPKTLADYKIVKKKLKKLSGPEVVKVPGGPVESIPIPVPRRGKVKRKM